VKLMASKEHDLQIVDSISMLVYRRVHTKMAILLRKAAAPLVESFAMASG